MTENEAILWIEAFKKTYQGFPEESTVACDMAITALKGIQQYREIGTVEECREAREKQIPKNPVLRIDNGKLRKSCPVCGCFFSPLSRSCPKCGQAILQENKDD